MDIKSTQRTIINKLENILLDIHAYAAVNKEQLFSKHVEYRLQKTLLAYDNELSASFDKLYNNDTLKYELKIMKKLNGG